jgi:isocitrate/isopropylmalate dehydrogenase
VAVDDVHIGARAVHGSAPDIAGRGPADPVARIPSSGLLLDRPGIRREEARLVRTRDLGGSASTDEFTGVVVSALRA